MIPSNSEFKQSLTELKQENQNNEFDFFEQDKNESPFLGADSNEVLLQQTTEETIISDNNSDSFPDPRKSEPGRSAWMNESFDGKLAVDVFQTPEYLVIQSTIAGCDAEDIDISINNEVITIRGVRTRENSVSEDDYFYQECYWGGFSRSIILPMEVDPQGCQASMTNGILTVKLPKRATENNIIPVQNIDEGMNTDNQDISEKF